MESEKAKEIKKALEDNAKTVTYADILTLINELESENERLSKELDSEWKDRRKAEENLHRAQWNYKIGLGQSRKRNKELKDRIAELEKENKRLATAEAELQKLNIKYYNEAKDLRRELAKAEAENEKRLKASEDFATKHCRMKCEIAKMRVKEFAEKIKNKVYPFLQAEMYNKKYFITGNIESDICREHQNQNVGIIKAQDVLSKWFKVKIDELLKEYEI